MIMFSFVEFRFRDLLDILVIAFLIYRVLLLLVETRAMQLVRGIAIIGVTAVGARFLDLKILSWLSSRLLGAFLIAIPIIFQPELRKMLEEIGRGRLLKVKYQEERSGLLADDVARALMYLQGRKIGALLVLQRDTGLKEIWRSAVTLRSEISQETLVSIFWPGNPLHDGAAILDREMIIAAACYLPLAEGSDISRWYGTRHRAALGVTEISDALAFAVSEERGEITLASNGRLSRPLNEDQVKKLLQHYFSSSHEDATLFERIREEIQSQWPGTEK